MRKLRQEQLSNLPKVTEPASASQDLKPGRLAPESALPLAPVVLQGQEGLTGKKTQKEDEPHISAQDEGAEKIRLGCHAWSSFHLN